MLAGPRAKQSRAWEVWLISWKAYHRPRLLRDFSGPSGVSPITQQPSPSTSRTTIFNAFVGHLTAPSRCHVSLPKLASAQRLRVQKECDIVPSSPKSPPSISHGTPIISCSHRNLQPMPTSTIFLCQHKVRRT
jgi:hypothetical protein